MKIEADASLPFDRWLARELTKRLARPVQRSAARRAIRLGWIAVGGKIERDPSRWLRRGPSVFIRDFAWLKAEEDGEAEPLTVLFEDEWIIALDKPPGLPTHETKDPGRASLKRQVEVHVGGPVFVHHRLDAGTSGVVLFAKAARANGGLARAFENHEVEKTYVAVIQAPRVSWPDRVTVEAPLATLPSGSVIAGPEGVSARTGLRVVERGRAAWLVEAKPFTGRKHQIRVHLASLGSPVVGDRRYGSVPRGRPQGRLMLHALRLGLKHPVTGKPLEIVSPLPAEFREIPCRAQLAIPPPSPERGDAAGEPRGRPASAARLFSSPSKGKAAGKARGLRRPPRARARDSRR